MNGGAGGGGSSISLYSGSAGQTILLNSQGNSYFTYGNLGIGTNSPAAKLNVVGDSRFSSEDAAWTFDAAGTNRFGIVKKTGYYPSITAASGAPIIFAHSNNADLGTSVTSQTLSERMRIDSNGNVGIGTSSPNAKLDVQGGSLRVLDNTAPLINFSDNSSRNWDVGLNPTTDAFYIKDVTASATRLTIDTSGNVGIGTTSPLYNLEVAKASSGSMLAVNADMSAAGEASVIAFTSKQYNTYYKAAIIAYDPYGGSWNRRGLALCVNGTADGTNASYANDKALYIAPDKTSTFYGTAVNIGDGTSSGNAVLGVNGSTNISNIYLARSDTSWGINNETDLRFYYASGRTASSGKWNHCNVYN